MTEPADAAAKSPFQLLRSWEDRVRRHGCKLPRVEDAGADHWTGIGFMLRSTRAVAPMDQVLEIGHYPKLTRVPGCKPWLRGLANLRGRLVTVVDLAGFLTGDVTAITPRSRVLEVRDESVPVGLLVAEMAGLRHFRRGGNAPGGDVAPWLAPFASEQVADARGEWTVVDLKRLVRHPEFLRAAL